MPGAILKPSLNSVNRFHAEFRWFRGGRKAQSSRDEVNKCDIFLRMVAFVRELCEWPRRFAPLLLSDFVAASVLRLRPSDFFPDFAHRLSFVSPQVRFTQNLHQFFAHLRVRARCDTPDVCLDSLDQIPVECDLSVAIQERIHNGPAAFEHLQQLRSQLPISEQQFGCLE